MRAWAGILAALNLAAAAVFLALAFLVPLHSELSVRTAFTELDRAGVINAPALNARDPRYAFDPKADLDYRRTVPIFIAAAPLQAERFNAVAGLFFTLMNAIILSTAWFVLRRRERLAA